MILLTLLVLLFSYFIKLGYSRWRVYHHMTMHFPSPPRHPIMGTLGLFRTNPPGIFKALNESIRNYGKNVILSRPIFDVNLVISDHKDIEILLVNPNTKKAKKSFGYRQLEPWLGTGLLTSYGEKWFARRKIITPSFHFSILDGFVEVMGRQSDILVKHLKSKVGAGDVDISGIINAFALDVICETSMGVTVNAQSTPDSKYVTSVKKMTVALQKQFFHPIGKLSIYDLTSNGQYLKHLIKVLHGFTNKVITERREQLLKKDVANKGSRMNFLDILLHATIDGKPLTNDDIREEVDTFMFEGHDTTASGIGFSLYLLSRHPEIQDRVYHELVEVFGSKDHMEITNKKLNELTYLDMVIKESLRMMPPVAAIGRELMEDTIIGGINVPAGVNILLAIYAMHHDPDNFTDPEKFDPERFSPFNERKEKSFAYVPFSAGGRNCIGQKFAMLDLKASISKVIMNYRLLASHEIILQSDVILKSSNGVYVKIENR